ncbi:hypothetical protein ACHQM5_000116 [Ranunculus cassubicifolius]
MTSITPLSSISPSSRKTPSSSSPFLKSPPNRSLPVRKIPKSNSNSSIFCCYNENQLQQQEKKIPSSLDTINGGSGFPVSLRIIKMKRQLSSEIPETLPLSLDMSVIKSVSSILLMIDEFFKYKGDTSDDPIVVSRDFGNSFVSLIKKVLFESPTLFFETTNLVSDLIVFSVSKYAPKDCEIGEISEYDRTRMMYERLIFDDPEDALILCNYAQFLYKIANDNDRAEELFKRAVQVKPVDGEALCQYGTFLWQKRGDIEAAEAAFIAAIEAEPRNCYHESRYASFLWETGGADTCFPLEP